MNNLGRRKRRKGTSRTRTIGKTNETLMNDLKPSRSSTASNWMMVNKFLLNGCTFKDQRVKRSGS